MALSWATPALFLIIWELTSRAGWLDERFFPSPSTIVRAGGDLIETGVLQHDTYMSAMRVILGFALGTFVGVMAGLALGVSRLCRAAFEPFLSALYTVPKLAILPLLLLIFGIGEVPKILLVAMTVFFLIWISTMEAILAIPEAYQEAARSFGARGWTMFRHVTWPALMPQLFVAMRLSIGTAVLVIVGVEFVQSDDGLGYRIWHSWSLFAAKQMYVGICVVAVLGLVFSLIVKLIGRMMTPWAPRHDGTRRV